MLSRVVPTVVVVLAGFEAQAAALLKGVVTADELGGPPMSHVSVSAIAGTNPTETHFDGTFTLQFPTKQPGAVVHIIIQKDMFEVINDIQLEVVLPIDPDANPLRVLLCRKGNREEMARRYYRLRSFEAIEVTYRRRLNELQEERRASI